VRQGVLSGEKLVWWREEQFYCNMRLLSALTGMITFWAMYLGRLGVVKDVLVNILSGMLIPIWFFPPFSAGRFLPFQ
jgi:ABC-type uncharacterized transport system permease subunit